MYMCLHGQSMCAAPATPLPPPPTTTNSIAFISRRLRRPSSSCSLAGTQTSASAGATSRSRKPCRSASWFSFRPSCWTSPFSVTRVETLYGSVGGVVTLSVTQTSFSGLAKSSWLNGGRKRCHRLERGVSLCASKGSTKTVLLGLLYVSVFFLLA